MSGGCNPAAFDAFSIVKVKQMLNSQYHFNTRDLYKTRLILKLDITVKTGNIVNKNLLFVRKRFFKFKYLNFC